MDFTADFYWSVRSPFCYIAMPRVLAMARDYGMQWTLRVVRPIALRDPGFHKGQHPLARAYHFRDCERVAQFHGLPYRRPRPDPVAQDPASHEVARDQPHANRLTLLAAQACREGKGLAFADELSRTLWNGETEDWTRGAHLAQAAARAGLDLARMEDAIARDPAPLQAQLRENEAAQQSAGHWGVPLFVFRGEPFFGQDRLDVLLWRMKQAGLARR